MLKNQKVTIMLVVFAVITVVASGYLIWNKTLKEEAEVVLSQNANQTVNLNEQKGSDTIDLQSKPAEQKDPNALSVDDSQSNSSSLGSGSRNTSVSGATTSAKEDFSQYEQYKDKTEVFYGDVVVGTGAEAVKDAKLAVTYKGYLTSGQMFDQSRPANNGQLQPLLFTLGSGQLIPGFEQGVAGMKVGGTRRVIIPPSLGYGAAAQGSIPANSVLIFDIQLTAAQ